MERLRQIFITLLIICFYLKIVISALYQIEDTPVILNIIMYVLCFVSIDFRRINYILFVVIGFLVISLIIPTARSLAFLFLFLYVMRNISLRYIAFVNVILSVAVLLFAWMGINNGMFIDKQTIQMINIRNDFGFNNPNAFALFSFGLCVNIYYLLAKNHKLLTFLFIMPFAWWVGSYSGSRTFAFSLFIMMLTYLLHRNGKEQRVLFNKKIFTTAPFVLAAIVVIGALLFSNNPIIDLFFSYRLSLYKQLITQTSVSGYLFGSEFLTKITIDNSYLQLMFMGGIGGIIMFLYLYIRTIKIMPIMDNWILPMFLGFLVYGTAESILTMTYMFGTMFFWIYLFQHGLADSTSDIKNANQ